MDREGFRSRLKQYKKAREENPGLKYWEWKDVPKYDEGTDNVLDQPLGDIQIKPFKGFYSIFNNAANWLANKKKDEIFGDLPLKEIRNRLYKNMVPWSYADVEERLIETVKNNKPDPLYKQGISADERDDIFAEYLEIPQQLRKNSTYKVVQSNYKPTKNAGQDEYKTISNLIKVSGEKLIDDLHKKHISETLASGEHNSGNLTTKINEFEYLPINKNKVVNTFGNLFGPHTIGRGVDPQKGEYVSFYDDWDLAPFGGGKDESNGVGKPVKFYDRLYLDDFYGVSSKPKDEDYYGGYLPEVEVKPKKYKDGGEVTGPPTYEQWDAEMNQYNPTVLDNASMYWSLEAAKKDLHKQAMGLPGYAPMWHEYVRSLPKADPDINQFVDDLWVNENPNNVGYRNGKYYPHKSPEGGKMTIGPGFKLDSGSHGINTKIANRGMTKTRLDQEARKIGKQHLKAVDQFINYGQTTNPADTVSPQIKMGLMDLRHQVGPLNEWSNLRQAVLEGDLDRIKKESTVTWNDNGKIKVDKRRKKIRDEKYFYYE